MIRFGFGVAAYFVPKKYLEIKKLLFIFVYETKFGVLIARSEF